MDPQYVEEERALEFRIPKSGYSLVYCNDGDGDEDVTGR